MSDDRDLVFRQPPLTNPADLVFGEIEQIADANIAIDLALPAPGFAASIGQFVECYFAATLPAPTFSALLGDKIDITIDTALPAPSLSVSIASDFVTIDATLPLPTVAVNLSWDADVSRPLVCEIAHIQSSADVAQAGVESVLRVPLAMPAGKQSYWQIADPLQNGSESKQQDTDHLFSLLGALNHRDAIKVPAAVISMPHQDMEHLIQGGATTRFQGADRVNTFKLRARWQDRYRDRRPSIEHRFSNGDQRSIDHSGSMLGGIPTETSWLARHQDAMRPGAGRYHVVPPIIPPDDGCYEPDPNLVFEFAPDGSTELIFWCDYTTLPKHTIVVPVRRVYMQVNTISLKRVSDNLVLPALNVSLSIDADSWTWGFSASLPASSQEAVMPGAEPVQLEATINGHAYRVLVEQIARERTFGNATIRISGRGINAVLASPYAPIMTFSNSGQRTAAQLMDDVLTINAVPMGWTVDWQLTDWLVPAGAFNIQGSHMDALLTIAGAAGGYIQPHPTNEALSVMLRYPVAPWDWNPADADYSLPSAVTLREGLQWVDKPAYNQVYVSGTSQGVLARVRLDGSAGDIPARMITDALITASDAARQRGIAVLGDTGRQVRLSLRLPILNETGIILPGKMVSYNDGDTDWYGIVRSTRVDASYPEAWQSLEVETRP